MAETNPNARLEAFSDGVFAIALTLLIIDIKIPSTAEITSTAGFWLALQHLVPAIAAFVLSFTIIFITWYNHHQAFKLIKGSSPSFAYANGIILLAVVFLPFPTALSGEYLLTDHAAPAVILYNSTIVLMALGWYFTFSAVLQNKLSKNEKATREIRKNRKYGLFSIIIYSLFSIFAIWFPLSIAFITVLLWAFWLLFGVRIKQEEID